MRVIKAAFLRIAKLLALGIPILLFGPGTSDLRAQTAGERAHDQQESPDSSKTGDTGSPEAEESPGNQVSYELEIEGMVEGTLLALLEESSQLKRLQEKPPASFAALERRIAKDLEAFDKVLRSEGYYAGRITSEIDRNSAPKQVIITVDSGPLFHLESYRITFEPLAGQPAPSPVEPADIGIKPGDPARAEKIVAAQREAIRLLARKGYPRAEIANQRPSLITPP